jgi:hypothetical protein
MSFTWNSEPNDLCNDEALCFFKVGIEFLNITCMSSVLQRVKVLIPTSTMRI